MMVQRSLDNIIHTCILLNTGEATSINVTQLHIASVVIASNINKLKKDGSIPNRLELQGKLDTAIVALDTPLLTNPNGLIDNAVVCKEINAALKLMQDITFSG